LDLNIGATVELLLISAAGAATASATAPTVPSVVFPLQNAMRTFETSRELDLSRPLPFPPRVHLVLRATSIGKLKRFEALWSCAFLRVVCRTNAELHPSLVVGCDHRSHLDGGAGLVGFSDLSCSPSSSCLVWSWMRTIPGIAANSALHTQLLLMHEPAAIALIVVVVGRSFEAISPCRCSSCRVLQVAMTLNWAKVQ